MLNLVRQVRDPKNDEVSMLRQSLLIVLAIIILCRTCKCTQIGFSRKETGEYNLVKSASVDLLPHLSSETFLKKIYRDRRIFQMSTSISKRVCLAKKDKWDLPARSDLYKQVSFPTVPSAVI
jgi:hypothetical protein